MNVFRCFRHAGQRLTAEVFDKLLDEISMAKHELAGKLANEKRR